MAVNAFGGVASPLMKMQARPHSELPQRLCPLHCRMWLNGRECSRRASATQPALQDRRAEFPSEQQNLGSSGGGRSGTGPPATRSMTNTSPKRCYRKQLYKALVHANKALSLALTSPLLWQPVHFKEQSVGDWKTESKMKALSSAKWENWPESHMKVQRLASRRSGERNRDVTGISKPKLESWNNGEVFSTAVCCCGLLVFCSVVRIGGTLHSGHVENSSFNEKVSKK